MVSMDTSISIVYWDEYIPTNMQDKPFYLAATTKGLCRVTWPSETFETLQAWVRKCFPNATLIHSPHWLSEYTVQFQQYFAGERKQFELPLDMQGTAFQKQVWQALSQIPHGQTCSYSDIAHAIERPLATRAVGTANGANPIPVVVPCHRVIGKDSALTGFRGGLTMKQTLLQLEGYDAYLNKGHERFRF
jgi:methylated-DNA-[protein]-cysteine S-methyltransferase